MKKQRLLVLTCLLTLASYSTIFAQQKPTLTLDDYQEWQNLSWSSWLSDDGSWAAYQVRLVNEKDTLYINSVEGDQAYKFAYSRNPKFSPDGKWVAFAQGVSPEKAEQMKKKKQRVENKMVLLNLESGKEEMFESISQFGISNDSKHVVMSTYPPKGSKLKGKDLIVHNLNTGMSRNIGNVSEWSINDKGNLLAYIIDAEKKRGNGVELFNLEKYQISFLASDTTTFKKLSWEDEQSALTFMQAFYDTAHTQANHRIFAYNKLEENMDVMVLDPSDRTDFPEAMRIRETYTPRWSEDLERIFIGIDDWEAVKKDEDKKEEKKEGEGEKKKKPKAKKDEKVPDMEIWHWKDADIIPRQRRTYNRDKNFTYLSVWNTKDNKFVRIEDDQKKNASMVGDGEMMVLLDQTPYDPQFRLLHADVYLADAQTGDRKLAMKKFPRNNFYGSSPDGKYLLYFIDNNWHTYDVANNKHINLTEDLDIPFWNTRYDGPREILPPFGGGVWMKDDAEVLLYDEYDVWAFKPDGSGYRKLTDGKKKEMVYRPQWVDYEEPYMDPEEPMFFRVFGDKTKESGYVQVNSNFDVVDELVMDKRIRSIVKAKDADVYAYYMESYDDSPDVFVSTGKLGDAKQISNTNPQQEDYAWGKTELIEYKNADGKKLQGLLHYPANYEKGKKYPMITYIYERRTDSKNNYVAPTNRRAYNFTHYIQNGYFVFQPDIVYKTNHPGESAVDCVVPAVEKAIKTGMIDKDKVGIMGHSWGGYQTAFLVTQTDIFSAAIAGAPLTNMISMYNSIYWNSGTPDQQIFETSQGRLREPYWNLMDEYIANSPIFQAQNIKTPMLMTFGDKDGAVDYHQGIEMYITMRRLSKPLIMLLYAGENHGLAKKENQIDYFTKVTEFFDHHLKGNTPKEWITEG
ncbi:MAG: prolyl oligopeptidase family serine peptidase, partial [Bacteroidota bacterium]